MVSDDNRGRSDSSRTVSRRALLAATGGLAAGALAGCSATQPKTEFTVTGAALPKDAQQKLTLDEGLRDSVTIKRSVDAIDQELTITNKVAAYARGPARGRPTLMEAYLGQANGTPGSGSAVVAYGDDLGIDGVTLSFLDGNPSVPANQVSVVAPGSLRGKNAVAPISGPYFLASGIETDQLSIPGINVGYVVDLQQVLPGKRWLHVDNPFVPSTQWIHDDAPFVPSTQWIHDDAPFAHKENATNAKVLVALGDHTPEEVFGVSADEMPGRRVEAGETIDWQPFNPFLIPLSTNFFTGNNPFLQPIPSSVMDEKNFLKQVFEVGQPAPLGGQSFGLGVLATPAAKVAGQAVNPLAGLSFQDLLTSDQALPLLKKAGVTDAETLEWQRAPKPMSVDSGESTVTILGQETDLKSFEAFSPGKDGPWWVGLHMARVEHEGDIVIVAGAHRVPVLSGSNNREMVDNIYTGIAAKARNLTGAVDSRLVPTSEL